MIEVRQGVRIPRAAAEVWAVVADYRLDPLWRKGVETMGPEPADIVRVGTTTSEVMRFAGREYRNGGEVVALELGKSFRWRTTSGINAEGSRTVEAVDPITCRFTFEVRVVPVSRVEKLTEPVLRWMLRKAIRADLQRLTAYCTSLPGRPG